MHPLHQLALLQVTELSLIKTTKGVVKALQVETEEVTWMIENASRRTKYNVWVLETVSIN